MFDIGGWVYLKDRVIVFCDCGGCHCIGDAVVVGVGVVVVTFYDCIWRNLMSLLTSLPGFILASSYENGSHEDVNR